MKQTTEKLKELFEDDSLFDEIENLQSTNPEFTSQETTIQEAYDKLLEIRPIIIESIEKGLFDDIPYGRRNALLSSMNNMKQYRKNASQFLPQFNAFYGNYVLTNLSLNLNENLDIVEKFKDLDKLRARYHEILTEVEKSEDIKKSLEENSERSSEILENLESTSDKASTIDLELTKLNEEIVIKKDSIEVSEQDIENRKKEILAFAKNIERNEDILLKIQNELSTTIEDSINSKTTKAKELISEAEQALELKQTEGISKAYSSRLSKLNKENSKKGWLAGSIAFVAITLIIGYLLTGGNITWGEVDIRFSGSDNIAFIVGRIMLTGIGISGAVFCANRYVHIKNLEEDYEYKVVLSKSILAFSNKIKELDKGKLAEYLTKVLHDLHQDPLRERNPKKEKVNLINLDQLKDVIKQLKE